MLGGLYFSVTLYFVPLRQGLWRNLSLSLFLSLSWLDQKLESPNSYPVFNTLSSGITGVCRAVPNFCLGTGIQMAVFMLAQQALLVTKPSVSTSSAGN